MIKWLIGIFVIFSSTFCCAQRVRFRVSRNMLVTFPSQPDSVITKNTTIYRVNGDSISYQAAKSNSPLPIQNEKDFLSALEQVYERNKTELAVYNIKRVDTTLSGFKGIYLHGITSDTAAGKNQVFEFLTVIDGYVYTVECLILQAPVTTKAAAQFFHSVRFGGANFPFKMDERTLLFRAGQMVAYLVILSLFIPLFLLLRKWTKRL